MGKKAGAAGTDTALDAVNEERAKCTSISECLVAIFANEKKTSRTAANKVQDQFHNMKVNKVKNADLPPCIGVYILKVQAYVTGLDLKFLDCIALVGYDNMRMAAPSISNSLDSETQMSICDNTVAEFVRHHSQKKTESDTIKEKLGELLRAILLRAKAPPITGIAKHITVLIHPRVSSHKEVSNSLDTLSAEKEQYQCIRALANLPPCEQWFLDAREYANEGAKMTAISDRHL